MIRKMLLDRLQGERAWPLLLLLLFLIYTVVDRIWWPTTTYVVLSFLFLAYSIAKFLEYFFVQKRTSVFLFIIVYFAFFVAFALAAFIGFPYYDFTFLRPTSRLVWTIAMPVFMVAVWFHCWWVYYRIKERLEEAKTSEE